MNRLLITSIILTCIILYITPVDAQESTPSLSAKPENADSSGVGSPWVVTWASRWAVSRITVAPEASIRTVDQLHVGVRFVYQYFSSKNYFYDTRTGEYLSYTSNVIGGAIYLRYYLSSLFDNFLGNLFAHTEYEYLVYNRPYTQTDGSNGYILGPITNTTCPARISSNITAFLLEADSDNLSVAVYQWT